MRYPQPFSQVASSHIVLPTCKKGGRKLKYKATKSMLTKWHVLLVLFYEIILQACPGGNLPAMIIKRQWMTQMVYLNQLLNDIPREGRKKCTTCKLDDEEIEDYATNNTIIYASCTCCVGWCILSSNHSRTNPTPKRELYSKDLLLLRSTQMLNQVWM